MKGTHTTSYWVIAILLVCAAVLWPLVRPGFYLSDDGEWMVIRLSAFFQSLRDGQVPTRFLGRLNHSYGYPVSNFLYPGFLYLGSVIHGLGFSFVNSVKIILAGSVIATSLALFFWLRLQFTILPSLFGAAGFVFAPYLLYDLYVRGSVGEVLAFVPAAIGLFSIDSNKRLLFPLVVALLIVSHNSLAAIFLLVLLGYLVVRKKEHWWREVLLGLGLVSFFWFPALVERQFVVFDSVSVSRPQEYFVSGNRWILLGPGALFALLLVLLIQRKRDKKDRFFLLVCILSVFFSTSLSLPVWSLPVFAKLVQFPYRFSAALTLCGSYCIARALEGISRQHRALVLITWMTLWFIPAVSILRAVTFVHRPEGYYTTNEATTTVADEYMPRWVQEKPTRRPPTKVEWREADGKFTIQESTSRRIVADVRAQQDSTMQINTIYYPGWGVTVDGARVPIDYQNLLGVMRIMVPQGEHRVVAEFRETPTRFFTDFLSAISILSYSWIFVKAAKGRMLSTV